MIFLNHAGHVQAHVALAHLNLILVRVVLTMGKFIFWFRINVGNLCAINLVLIVMVPWLITVCLVSLDIL
jgi:hypothetical protein